jgi:hypothetical protein
MTGVPCPFCGLTRATVAAVHGHLAAALSYNPAVVVVLGVVVVLMVRPNAVMRARLPVWAVLGGLGALWCWNIGFNPTFNQLLR